MLLLLFIATITDSAFGQWSAYYPDGKKINIEFRTIKQLLDTLGANETTDYSHKLGDIYFKRLTNKPVFILFDKKANPTKIKEMIASYNYSEYLNSYSYYWDLKDMIGEGTLNKKYLKEVFSEPDIKGEDVEKYASEYWIYKKYNVKINFDGDSAAAVDVVNYNAISKNGLAISAFEVTGGDYNIGLDISLTNYAAKTIKYAFISVTVTNPVHDKIGTKTLTAVGPIEHSKTGSYQFENVLYSNVAEYLVVDNIKIQYMDGSIKNIAKNEIDNITITDWEEYGKRIVR